MPTSKKLGQLSVELVANIKQFADSIKAMEKQLSGMGAAISKLTTAVTGLSKSFTQSQTSSRTVVETMNRIDGAARKAAGGVGTFDSELKRTSRGAKKSADEIVSYVERVGREVSRIRGRVVTEFRDMVVSPTGLGRDPFTGRFTKDRRQRTVSSDSFISGPDRTVSVISRAEQDALTRAHEKRRALEGLADAEAKNTQRLADEGRKRFQNLFANLAEASRIVVQRSGQGFFGQLVGQEELGRIAAANKQFADLNRNVHGLLGIPNTGSLFNRIFGNFIDSMKTATSLIVRFQIAVGVVNAVSQSFSFAVRSAVEFEDAMAQVAAITGEVGEEGAANIQLLGNAIRDIAKNSIVSATEAAKGVQILAQAGLSAAEATQTIKPLLALTIGGVASVEQSANLLTSTLKAFNLTAEDSTSVANILVATVNKSKSSIEDLNVAFNFAGTSAANAGLQIQDLSAIVGVLADNGVKASTQGTAVRQAISSLIAPGERAQAVFRKLGINLKDINPLFNDIADVLDTLRDNGFGTAQAFEAFDQRAASAIQILVNNSRNVRELREEISGTNAAFEAFETRQESLSAKLQILSNRFAELAIQVGELGALKAVVQVFSDLLKVISDYPAILGAIQGFGIAAIFLGASRAVKSFVDQLRAARLLQNVAQDLGAVAFGLNTTSAAANKATLSFASLRNALVSLRVAFSALLVSFGITAAIVAIGAAYEHVTRKAEETRLELVRQRSEFESNIKSNDQLINKLEDALTAFNKSKDGTEQYTQALGNVQAVMSDLLLRFPQLGNQIDLLTGKILTSTNALRQLTVVAPIENRIAEIKTGLVTELSRIETQKRNLGGGAALAGALSVGGFGDLEKQAKKLEQEADAEIKRLLKLRRTYSDVESDIERNRTNINELLFRGDRQGAFDLVTKQISKTERQILSIAEGLGVTGEEANKLKSILNSKLRKGEGGDTLIGEVGKFVEEIPEESQNAIRQIVQEFQVLRDTLTSPPSSVGGLASISEENRALDKKIAKLKIANQGLQAGTDAAAQGQARLAQETAEANAEFEEQIELADRKREKILAEAGLSTEDLARKLAGPEADAARIATETYDKLVLAATLERENKILQAKQQTLNAGLGATKKANDEVIRLEADRQYRILLGEGKIQEAINVRFEAEKQIARLNYSGRTLALKLEAIEHERVLALIKENVQLTEEQVALDKKRHTNRIEQINEDFRIAKEEIELDELRLERGVLPGGRARNREAIEKRKINAEILQQTDLIKTNENALAVITARRLSLQENITEEGRNTLAQLDEEEAQRLKDISQAQQKTRILQEQLGLVRRAGEVAINFSDSISQAISDAFEGIINGTSKLSDVFKNFGTSILKQITGALSQALVEKLGFDKEFILNMQGLGESTKGILGGAFSFVFDNALALLQNFLGLFVGGLNGATQGLASGGGGAPTSGGTSAGVLGNVRTGVGVISKLYDLYNLFFGSGAASGGSLFSFASSPVSGAYLGGSFTPTALTATSAVPSFIEVTGAVAENAAAQTGLLSGITGILGSILALVGAGYSLYQIAKTILKSFLPDIEIVFNKLFTDFLESANILVNRQLENPNQGLGPRGRARRAELFGPGTQLGEDAAILSRLASTLVGAGSDNFGRINRFFNILTNSLASGRRDAEGIQKALYEATRSVGQGSFVRALKIIESAFRQGDRRKTFTRTAARLVGRAFQETAVGADLEEVAEILQEGNFLRNKKGGKQSRKVVKEAAGELFGSPNFDDNFANFANKLAEAVKGALQQGIIQAFVVQGPIGVVLTQFFAGIKREFKRTITKGGLTEEAEDRLRNRLENAGKDAARLLKEYKEELRRVFELTVEFSREIDELIQTDEQKIDKRRQLIQSIRDTVGGLILSLNELLKTAFQTQARLIQKIFNVNNPDSPGVAPKVVEFLKVGALLQFNDLKKNFPALTGAQRLAGLQSLEGAVDEFVSTATQAIRENYQEAIEIAKRAKDLFKTVKDQILSIALDRQDVTAQDKLSKINDEIIKQKNILASGKPEEQLEAAQELQELYAQQLEIAQESLDQSGPQFASVRNAVTHGLQQVANFLETQGAKQEELETLMLNELKGVGSTATQMYEFIKEQTLLAIEQEAKDKQDQLKKITDILLGATGKASIADALNDLGNLPTRVLEELANKINLIVNETPETNNVGLGPQSTERALPVPSSALRDRAKTSLKGGRYAKFAKDEIFNAMYLALDVILGQAPAGQEKHAQAMRELIVGAMRTFKIPDELGFYEIASMAKQIRDYIDEFSTIYTWLKSDKVLDKFFGKVGFIQPLAKGGIAAKRMLAEIAEAGVPEAAVPFNSQGVSQFIGILSKALATNESQLALQAMHSTMAASSGSGPVSIELNVQPGAFVTTIPNGDRRQVAELPANIVDFLIREVKYGKLGKVIESKVR